MDAPIRSRGATLAVRVAALLALLPVAWAVTVGAFHDRHFAVDDSFISYRFARNLADGFGLSWNPGSPPCEGYTNFLYVVVVAAFVRMGVPAPSAGLAVGIASSLALLVVAWRLVRPARWASLACAALAILWLWRPEPRIHASRGLETALFVALIGLLLAQAKCTPIAGGGASRDEARGARGDIGRAHPLPA
jgi:hypothetical protein